MGLMTMMNKIVSLQTKQEDFDIAKDAVFIGLTFTNDRYPRTEGEWELLKTLLREGASIDAGPALTKDVPANTTICGNPTKTVKKFKTLRSSKC